MSALSFKDRANALENQFFNRVDAELLAKLRNELAERDAKAALRIASGIWNDEVLTELVRIGVGPETVAAVSLIPLVAIAWADNKVTEAERKGILVAEKAAGVAADSVAHQLLTHWLDENPGEELLEAWKHFIHELRGKLSPDVCPLLDSELLERAETVAKASGGYWSYGSVSPLERSVLDDVRETLRRERPA